MSLVQLLYWKIKFTIRSYRSGTYRYWNLSPRNNSLISYFLKSPEECTSCGNDVNTRLLLEEDENICPETTRHLYPRWAENTKSKSQFPGIFYYQYFLVQRCICLLSTWKIARNSDNRWTWRNFGEGILFSHWNCAGESHAVSQSWQILWGRWLGAGGLRHLLSPGR